MRDQFIDLASADVTLVKANSDFFCDWNGLCLTHIYDIAFRGVVCFIIKRTHDTTEEEKIGNFSLN